MNPENSGQHIVLHHNSLWRSPLFLGKKVEDKDQCHHQLNQLGLSGASWRTRNNFISSNSNYSDFKNESLTARKTKVSIDLNEILKEDKKHSNLTRSMLKSIKPDSDALERSELLYEGIKKLKDMDLLTNKQIQRTKFPGVIKHEHVYNDYHGRVANPGYSRNYMGKIFTK